MKIVFLDRGSIGKDLDLTEFSDIGETVIYDYSTTQEIPDRIADADVVVLNKPVINEKALEKAKHLRLICVTGTGTNNLDKEALAKKGIAWRNVAGYSTESVAQHTFAMLFYLMEHLAYYDSYVKSGSYVEDRNFTHFETTFHELSGKTWGVIGLGTIGKRVADIAAAFGVKVIYYSTSGNHHDTDYEEVSFDMLLSRSDIISIHAPLNEKTQGLLNQQAFEKMKRSAILINSGRGAIVEEKALAHALEKHQITAAGIDVLETEPMAEDCPLRQIQDSDRLIITPHIAWAAVEARERLIKTIAGQIREFLKIDL